MKNRSNQEDASHNPSADRVELPDVAVVARSFDRVDVDLGEPDEEVKRVDDKTCGEGYRVNVCPSGRVALRVLRKGHHGVTNHQGRVDEQPKHVKASLARLCHPLGGASRCCFAST